MDETSIWKKEITFRRKPKAQEAGMPVQASQPAAPAEQTSIWKKEITFGRKPKTQTERFAVPPAPPVQAPPSAPRPSAQPLDHVMPPVAPQAPAAAPPMPAAAPPAPVLPPVNVPGEPAPPVGGWNVAPPLDPVAPVEPRMLQPLVEEPTAVLPPVPDPAAEQAPASAEPAAGQQPQPGPPSPEATPGPVEPESKPSRREQRETRRAAEQTAKEREKRAKQVAKDERKANPSRHARVVGLKIGASQIAAAEVVNKGGPRVIRMARTPLERGVVVGGELRDPDKLAAALKAFFRKNKLPRSCVRLGVSNNRIGVRTFEIAGIDDERQLANAIRFRAQEALPIPLAEAVLDYRVLDDRFDDEGVRVRRVLLVVAHRDLVERYAAACRKAGLKLIGIDLEAFALLRTLADPAVPSADDAAVVGITIGHDRSTLAVSDGRVCEFTRVLAWGGSSLDAAVARLLDVPVDRAESIRHDLGRDESGESAGLDRLQVDEVRRALGSELQVFAREVVASLRFYQEQPGSLGISEILVTGGVASANGLAAELERLIGIPVRVADPLARVTVPRKLRADDAGTGSLAVAVGLGIED